MLGSSWVNGVESVRGEGGLGCAAEVGTEHLQGVTQIWFNWEIMGKDSQHLLVMHLGGDFYANRTVPCFRMSR